MTLSQILWKVQLRNNYFLNYRFERRQNGDALMHFKKFNNS
jgi:hypothetical protein